MRKLFLLAVLAPCVALLIGCPKKKEEAPGADAEVAAPVAAVDAAPAAPALPAAKNAADVARFPAAEKPVTDDDVKLVEFFSAVRTGPKQGAVVATLARGVDPVKIAEHQDCFLIQFADPKDPNSQLMGWIPKASFTTATIVDAGRKDATVTVDAAVAVVVPVAAGCPAGQEAIVNIAAVPVCRKKCTADAQCKTPTAGACHTANTVGGKVVKVCAAEAP
jgi:hypothetical protein